MSTTLTEKRHINLDDLIPSPAVAAGYVNRTVKEFLEFDTFDAAVASGHNVLIEGPTGSGKTFSYRAYAAARGLPFYTVAMNQALDMGVLLGGWVPDGSGQLVWFDGVIPTMIKEERGVVLFDELNMAAERNVSRFYDFWDSRREIVVYEHYGEVLQIAPGSSILLGAAYNRGYRGTRELSQALPNRFAFKMRFDYDDEIEAQLVPSASIREVAGKLRLMKREVKTPVSTNMLIEFCEIAMAFSTDYAIENWNQAFPPAERASVDQVITLHRDRISEEIEAASTALDQAESEA